MKNYYTDLYINGERVSVCVKPDECRAALIRHHIAPRFRVVHDCYTNPSTLKQHAERMILERIRGNTVCGGDYTVLSYNRMMFTAGYFLDAVNPITGETRSILCIETARNRYHFDVTGLEV